MACAEGGASDAPRVDGRTSGPAMARVMARVKGFEEAHDCTGWIAPAVARRTKETFDVDFGHLVDHWVELADGPGATPGGVAAALPGVGATRPTPCRRPEEEA